MPDLVEIKISAIPESPIHFSEVEELLLRQYVSALPQEENGIMGSSFSSLRHGLCKEGRDQCKQSLSCSILNASKVHYFYNLKSELCKFTH